jgi:NAD(P)H-hydrate repair Nnr-like enzyme with NAD(P)H-hydrate dehydratase domain
VLTPHDGEVVRLTGSAPGADRFATARDLARSLGVIVVLKGPTTIVAEPEGATLAVTAPDARLATAGTGDVLAGIIAAMLAGGQDPFHAAAAGVWIHGASAALGPRMGLVAGDLIDRIPQVWSNLMDADGST